MTHSHTCGHTRMLPRACVGLHMLVTHKRKKKKKKNARTRSCARAVITGAGSQTHTSVENHLGMSRSDCVGKEDVDMTLCGHRNKTHTHRTWLHDPDLQCAATIAELIHLIYVLLWALRGPAAEEIVHWGCKYGWQEQLSSRGMRRERGSDPADPDGWSRFLLII